MWDYNIYANRLLAAFGKHIQHVVLSSDHCWMWWWDIFPWYFYIRIDMFSSTLGCDGEDWYPETVGSSITQCTLPFFPPPFLMSLNLSTSPTSSPGLCVCAVVESVAGIQTTRKCRHKHWRGSMLSLPLWGRSSVHSSDAVPRLASGSCSRSFDDSSQTHTCGSTCGTHTHLSHVCLSVFFGVLRLLCVA